MDEHRFGLAASDVEAAPEVMVEAKHPGSGTRRLLGLRWIQGLLAYAVYQGAALLVWGRPILGRMSDSYFGVIPSDNRYYSWFMEWWPRALQHGTYALQTNTVWYPHGVNLAWTTSLPGPSLLMAPITLVFGPLASENVLALAAPALAAWGAYLLCRRITGRLWPSFLGGWLFGFSTYMVNQMKGHLNLILVFPVPLCAYLIVRRAEGTLRLRSFIPLLFLCLLAQFSISTEVFATMTLFGGIAISGAWVFGGVTARARLRGVIVGSLVSYLVVGIVTAPLLLQNGKGAPSHVYSASHYSTDLLGFVVPNNDTLIGGPSLVSVSSSFTVQDTSPDSAENGAYLGLPLLVLLGAYTLGRFKERSTKLLVGFAAFLAICSLGPFLHVDGTQGMVLPWRLAESLPLIRYALPARFTVYLALTVSAIAAIWLSSVKVHKVTAWGLAGLSAVAIFPNVLQPNMYLPHPDITPPAFFSTSIYSRYLSPGEPVVIVSSMRGNNTLWQTYAHMYFSLVIGPTEMAPKGEGRNPVVQAVLNDQPSGATPGELALFATDHGVQAFITIAADEGRWSGILGSIGYAPRLVAGVALFEATVRSPLTQPSSAR